MSSLAEFIKWGSNKSQDQNNPDVLELKVSDLEPFETTYSICVQVLQKVNGEWPDRTLPLKSHDSKNASLLNQWKKATNDGKLKPGNTFCIKTWLAQSKNGRPIRRYVLEA